MGKEILSVMIYCIKFCPVLGKIPTFSRFFWQTSLRQESPDRLEVFSIFSFFTNSSSFFLTTSSCCFLAGSSFFLTKSSCLRMIDRFLASATEGGNGDWESLSRGEARPVVWLEVVEELMIFNMMMVMVMMMMMVMMVVMVMMVMTMMATMMMMM